MCICCGIYSQFHKSRVIAKLWNWENSRTTSSFKPLSVSNAFRVKVCIRIFRRTTETTPKSTAEVHLALSVSWMPVTMEGLQLVLFVVTAFLVTNDGFCEDQVASEVPSLLFDTLMPVRKVPKVLWGISFLRYTTIKGRKTFMRRA